MKDRVERRNQKRAEDEKCQDETMMSTKTNRSLK